MKITQSAPNKVYRYVPIQNFKISENNDIDWSKSNEDINLQLYKKYGLDDTDVSFIEKMIKPMN